MIKIDFEKIFFRVFFAFTGFYTIFIVVFEFIKISVFRDILLVFLSVGFYSQILPFYLLRMRISKNSKNSKEGLKEMLLMNVFLLIYTFYLILTIITALIPNIILATFELLILMISVGSIKLIISFKQKNNYMFSRILLRIEFIITLSLSIIIFILNFFQHSSIILLISLVFLLGGISNLLYSFIWKFKN